MYEVIISPDVDYHISLHLKSGNKTLAKKIIGFLEELKIHPRTGRGKPERLKHYTQERWSRKIDDKHRLIYEIRDHKLIVIAISAYGHYDDKEK